MNRIEPIIGAMIWGNDFSNTSLLQGRFKSLAMSCREQVIKTGEVSFLKLYEDFKDEIKVSYLAGCCAEYIGEQVKTFRHNTPLNKYLREYPKEK
jgi:hypothetical protein